MTPRDAIMEKRAAIWFLADGRLCWFTFVMREDAPRVAARLRVMFRRPAVVLPFWWEPQ